MKKLFSDNLKVGFLLSVLAVILLLFRAGLLAFPVGVIAFFKSKKAVQEGKSWGLVGAILSAVVVLYILFLFFIVGNTLTKR